MSKDHETGCGCGGLSGSTLGMLGVAFVVLKLCGVIDWPWLLVLLPFWIAPVLLILAVTLFVMAAIVAGLIEGK